ncbi:MAG: hypothetical protein B6D64_08345 [Bacteroidetes bacterium 4484_276]|nr:MAG: hypothetical protein B6D64_08345 [Bacteroidetes bacterium 4484_276]
MGTVNTGSKTFSIETLHRFTPELVLVVYVILFFSIKQPYQDYDRVISSDGKAYYAYLTAIFIYHDLEYNFVESYEEKYYPEDRSQFKEFRFKFREETVHKGFPGMAFLLLPFFLLAHFLALIFGFAPDGYSLIYQYTMGIGALFYFWLGLKLVKNLLTGFSFSKANITAILILLAFGTNMIYYTINEGMMTHVYSFMLIALFMLSVRKSFTESGFLWLFLSALVFGLIVSVRPTNALVILVVPFLADKPARLTGLVKKVFSIWKVPPALTLIFLLFPFAVMLLWKLQTGYWLVYSYGDEGFDFLNPHFFQILFSFNKGWFVYTPLAFVSLVGLINLYRQSKSRFLWLAFFLIMFTYVASSWWAWHYTSNFGQRVFIDIYALIAILLGYLLNMISGSRMLKSLVSGLLVLLLCINCLQYYQHYKYVYPPGTIDAAIYSDSFFRLVPAPRANFPDDLVENREVIYNDFEKDYGWLNYASVTDTLAYEGGFSSRAGYVNEYSIGLYKSLSGLLTTGYGWVKVGFWMYSDEKYTDATMVIDFESEGKSIFYKPFYLKGFNIQSKWVYLEFAAQVPKLKTTEDMLRVYFFLQPGDELFLIDNLKVEVISLKEDFEFY